MIHAKAVLSRLDPLSYENLRQQVLCRDGWRCQSCGAMTNLEVHHRQFRSYSGADSEENLITLCTACHTAVHCSEAGYGQWLTPLDAKRGVTGDRE